MRFDRQPETKSCLGKINFKVGTQVLYFKNTQREEIIKKTYPLQWFIDKS